MAECSRRMPLSTSQPPAPRRDVAPASRRVGTANRRCRTSTRSRGDWPRRLHRMLPAVWVPPAPLCGRRMVPRAEPPEDVSRGEHLEPVHGAASDSDGASDRRVVQARSTARAHARHRQERRPLELRRRSHRRQPRRRRSAWGPERNRHLFRGPCGRRRSMVRRARAPRRGPLRVHEHHRVGVRARKAAGRPALPHRPDRVRASFRRDARRRRLRSGPHAGVARRVRSGVACGDLAVVLAAASGVRPARRHRDTALASRRSLARRSARPRRLSKAMRARMCRTDRASCCSSTFFT